MNKFVDSVGFSAVDAYCANKLDNAFALVLSVEPLFWAVSVFVEC